ncbi:hypothetical protein TUM12370_00810 [Salmonella enterica subsp. enterica serovar Choleraesuis]|nr:hypothetical protein TUM12370_00810 [Salmonella enterica subsp. enterica serovar Choleraesuis]
MKTVLYAVLLGMTTASFAAQQVDTENGTSLPTASYLLPGAPSFDMGITQFREKFNHDNPKLQLNEFRAIEDGQGQETVLRAASKINENLYASSALERGTLKIKSIQITWLPIQGPEQTQARNKAQAYMAALIHTFSPALSIAQSQQRLNQLLTTGKDKPFYTQNEGPVRYVVADNGEKGLTFAIEPIKLMLSEGLTGSR